MMLLLFIVISFASSCTNFLASSGSTTDGSTFITYNNDGFGSWPSLYYSPAKDWPAGTKILGKIPQVNHTYNVVHRVNELGVSFGETTWENMLPELTTQKNAIIGYGDLMWIILQRSATAREAIINIGNLLDEYGYKSTGETFSIADKNEVWIMEVVGKGNFEQPKLGAVWVARKIPEGYISGHANQARIQTFPLDDPNNCLYAKDTIQFARDRGWYSGHDKDFSFSDVYSPVTFESARWCEARVYSMFNKMAEKGEMDKYVDYVKGVNLTHRMPLWIKPSKKIDIQDVMGVMRSHYEGTFFDMVGSFDVGNQPFHSGDRYLPLKWKASNGKTYVFERPISIQKTGIAIICQMRNTFPDGIGHIQWFSFDDTMTNVYVPLYSSLLSVPPCYSPHGHFSYDSAFWILNMVSNWAYYRYDVISADIKVKQSLLESQYISEVHNVVDVTGMKIYQSQGKDAMYEYLSNYSVSTSNQFLEAWRDFFGVLFQKYYDSAGQNRGYDSQWYDFIVEKTGDHFLYRGKDPL